MKNNRQIFFLLIAVAAGVWVLNAYTIIALVAPTPATALNIRENKNDAFSGVIALADSALKCRPKTDALHYEAVFENPFSLLSEAFSAPVKKKNASSSLQQVKLTLKGVLLKEQPLAILEDTTGKTYICGIGEKIQENIVESIEPNRVTLRGSQGVYALSVKE